MSKLFVKDRQFYKTALMLALPIVLQNMITIGVNIMDTVMLGSYGEIQLSGSSLANEFINIFHILCMGMGCGAAVLTAQFWGKKDLRSLKYSVTIMMRICLSLAVLFTVVTVFAPSFIMRIFTDDPAVIEKGCIYFLWSAPTYLLMGISLTLTLILRSVRKVMVPLWTSIICFFVNIFFNWVFIFGNLGAPEMQIAGAALGTLIARVVETAIIGIYVLAVDKNIGFRIRDLFGSCGGLLPTYLKYSIPVLISDGMLALGNTMVSVIIGHISTEYVAANAIIATIVRLSTVFTQGLGQASSVMTGNALGQKETEKAYRQGVTFVTLSFLIGLFAAGVILALSPFIIGLYNIEDTTREIAHQLMYAVSIMIVFQSSQSMLTKGVLRGGGDTKFLMIADVAFLWIASVPLGALCGLVWHLSPFIIYIALKIDWAIKSFICLFRLKSKKWIRIV
ncbi:MAG: MATE family efflux transporter [Clostridia bacterium]|nr:MATE family efflux transporter [Clostridia bacterium]